MRHITALLSFLTLATFTRAAEPEYPKEVKAALERAKDNRKQLEKALADCPEEQRKGMQFLIQHMPDSDLKSLSAAFLLENTDFAYKARKAMPWGKNIPEELFLNDVLAYANVDESRDPWRKDFYEMCLPIVKECKTPAEAAQKLNSTVFVKLKVGYSTQRKKPNQSPKESIEQGKASCTGLSILLSNACRSVCIPARLVGTPNWSDKRGNHTWVEIWDKDWHFTGACEQDPQGLDRGWFVGDAAKAQKDVPEHAIYAASFAKTKIHFPLVWALNSKDVPGENVTDRYAKPQPKVATTAKVRIQITGKDGKTRIAVECIVAEKADAKATKSGKSRGETADKNDILTMELKPETDYILRVDETEQEFRTPAAGKTATVTVSLTKK